MKRIILALIFVGAFLIPTSASATVSPSKQAFMNQQGWTAGPDDVYDYGGSLSTITTSGATGGCAHSRARRVGSALRYRSGNPMVRGGIKLALCANNGQITAHEVKFRYASPGRYWKRDGIMDRRCNWPVPHKMFRCKATYRWTWDTPGDLSEFNRWRLDLTVNGWVRNGTDHELRFGVSREWE